MRFSQRLLGPLALGDVLDRRQRGNELARIVELGIRALLNEARLAVRADDLVLDLVARSILAGLLYYRFDTRAVVWMYRREKLIEVPQLSVHLAPNAIALFAGVHLPILSFVPNAEADLGDALGLGEPRLALPERLLGPPALGDVLDSGEYPRPGGLMLRRDRGPNAANDFGLV